MSKEYEFLLVDFERDDAFVIDSDAEICVSIDGPSGSVDPLDAFIGTLHFYELDSGARVLRISRKREVM